MASGPHWRKSPPELIERFAAALTGQPRAERRQMFGYPAAFVNGNMATGLHQDTWLVRLGAEDRAALTKQGGRPFEPMPGRPMREYVVLPPAVLSSRRSLEAWLERAIRYTASLPPKSARKKVAQKKVARKKAARKK